MLLREISIRYILAGDHAISINDTTRQQGHQIKLPSHVNVHARKRLSTSEACGDVFDVLGRSPDAELNSALQEIEVCEDRPFDWTRRVLVWVVVFDGEDREWGIRLAQAI